MKSIDEASAKVHAKLAASHAHQVGKYVKRFKNIRRTPRNIPLVVFVYTGAAEFRLFGMDRV